MTRVFVLALAIGLIGPGWARADLRITENTVGKAGGRTVEGVRTTYIQGTRMRIEVVQGDQAAVTLYDLDGGTIANLDAKKKRTEIYALAARNARLEKEYPRARTTVSLTRSGSTRTIAASPCEVYDFTVRVPISSDEKTALTLTGAACIAGAAPGNGDYRAFAMAARERELVIGWVSDNAILLSLARGQTELYRALSSMPGVPYLVDMTIGVDGKGMFAGMARKLLSGSRTATVTNVAADPLAATLFAVPDGWTRDKK